MKWLYTKFVLVVLACSAVFTSAVGQSAPTVRVECPKSVKTGKNFTVNYSMTGDTTVGKYDVAFQIPESVHGVKLVYGPAKTTSMYTEYINGKNKHTEEITWQFDVCCDEPGEYSFEPFKVTCRDDSLALPVAKKVSFITEGYVKGQDAPAIVLVASVDRSKVKLGGSVVYTVKILFRKSISELRQDKFSVRDCLARQISDSKNAQAQTVVYKGTSYRQQTLARYTIHPERVGKITIPAYGISGKVAEQVKVNNDFYYTTSIEDKPFRIKSNPVTLTVTK